MYKPGGQISPQLQFVQVLLQPNGQIVTLSTTGTLDEVVFTLFGFFNQNSPQRLLSWFLPRSNQNQDASEEYRITINAVGPKHAFGPSESMINVVHEKGGVHRLAPDLHFTPALIAGDIALRKQGLPTENVATAGTLAYDTAKRFEEISEQAGLSHLSHSICTAHQQAVFDKESANLCSVENIRLKKILIIWDYKRNIPLMSKWKQSKSDYYNVPTAAFFGAVIVYCGTELDRQGNPVLDNLGQVSV